jgi:hypothetical protein
MRHYTTAAPRYAPVKKSQKNLFSAFFSPQFQAMICKIQIFPTVNTGDHTVKVIQYLSGDLEYVSNDEALIITKAGEAKYVPKHLWKEHVQRIKAKRSA